MFLENMSTWLPISFRLIKFPLGFSFPCGFGILFSLFSGISRRNHKLKATFPDGKKVNPILCFVLKWISALHLVLLPRKILSDTLKPVVTILKGQLNEFGYVIG